MIDLRHGKAREGETTTRSVSDRGCDRSAEVDGVGLAVGAFGSQEPNADAGGRSTAIHQLPAQPSSLARWPARSLNGRGGLGARLSGADRRGRLVAPSFRPVDPGESPSADP